MRIPIQQSTAANIGSEAAACKGCRLIGLRHGQFAGPSLMGPVVDYGQLRSMLRSAVMNNASINAETSPIVMSS